MSFVQFIPNQPVFFSGADPNCGCKPDNFCQPILPSDVTNFQIPNKCPGVLGSELLSDTNFDTDCDVFSYVTDCADLLAWSEDDSNGGTNRWTVGGTYINAAPLSKILKQTVTIEPYKKYRFTLGITASSGVGCDIVVVGFNSDGTYDIINKLSADDALSVVYFEFSSTKEFVAIGFYEEGDCDPDISFNRLTSASLKEYSFDDCNVDITVKDGEGNIVGSGDVMGYFDNFIWGQVDWSQFDLEEGKCYRICVDTDYFFGENLFIYGDNGTFEDNADGVEVNGSAATPYVWTSGAHGGNNSTRALALNPANSKIFMATDSSSPIRLKPNTTYVIEAWIYSDIFPNPGDCKIYLGLLNALGSSLPDTSFITGADSQNQWAKISLEYTTDNTGTNCVIRPLIYSDNSGAWIAATATVYVDDVVVYEKDAYSICSAPFCLPKKTECTSLITYSNNEDAFGFIYPSGFEFNLRVAGQLGKPKYTSEVSSYDYDDGQRVITYANSRKIKEFIVENCPEYIHDALRLAVLHDNFAVDGVLYTVESKEYSPIWRDRAELSSVIIEVALATQDTRNNFL